MGRVLARVLGISALALTAAAATGAVAGGSLSFNGAPEITSGGPPLKAVSSLDCPQTEGDLTRTARAADGRSCDYRSADGETVRLSLIPLQGRSAVQALEPMKAQLHTLMPIYYRPPAAVPDRGEAGERTDIDLPFFHIHTAGNHADVRMFGVKVRSEGENADVNVTHGHKHTVVHAGPEGAEVVAEDIGRTNAALVYVLASEKLPVSGFWAVGYVAKGPVKGPLVVGEFRTTRKPSGHDGDHNGVGRLIDRNVRG